MATLNEYREQLGLIESGETAAEMAGDKAYAARVIHRELTTAAWQPAARAEAAELAGRALDLMRQLEEAR